MNANTNTNTNANTHGVGVDGSTDDRKGEETNSIASYAKKNPRERIFYHPIVNNLSIHIRCMLSLWEGLIGNLLTPGGGGEMNGSMSGSSSTDSGEKGWSRKLE